MTNTEKIYKGLNRLSGNRPMMEAADGKGDDYSTLKELAMFLLAEADALHVFHWNADTNSHHELLGEAYDLYRDTADKLGETYVVKAGKSVIPESVPTPTAKTWDPDPDVVLSRLKEVLDNMNSAVEKNPKFTEGVKNIFADFDEKMTTIIYKFSRFPS